MRKDGLILNKQAYLIIAHKDDFVFRTLLSMLDDSRNDIFIHMDTKNRDYDENKIEKLVTNSNVYHTQRTSVTWGDYSQINSELLLLKKAISVGKYQHYHLLSGSDLPLKSQDDIIDFFEENEGIEFIRFEDEKFNYDNRVQLYYPFQKFVGRGKKSFWTSLNGLILRLQRAVGIKRNKHINFQKGTNWFSITDSLACYVVEKEKWIKNVFRFTLCGDEVFLQTIVCNSEFRDKLYHRIFDNDMHAIMRYIDWERGNPYVFKYSDFNELIESEMLFARKFDENIDSKIVIELLKKINC